ncbi:hypothetical protein CJF32_00009925 [Rutstroemia sp. NJR-2017a WRK4]|nr:hypothetical protein CJF32_00009925 [Rutstroemia sp. NJR-2017a WRK4]
MPEAVVSKTFGTFLDRLQRLHLLERFVFDKCYIVLDSTTEFRPKIRYIATLYRARVYEDHTDPGRRVEYEEEEEDTYKRGEIVAVYRLMEQKLEEYTVPTKIIIYSSSIVTIQEVSRILGCYTYYRDIGEAAVKDEIRKV